MEIIIVFYFESINSFIFSISSGEPYVNIPQKMRILRNKFEMLVNIRYDTYL